MQIDNTSKISRECQTHPWSAWSICTVKCGQGTQFRTRVYKHPEVAAKYNCDLLIQKREERSCFGEQCGDVELINFNSNDHERPNQCQGPNCHKPSRSYFNNEMPKTYVSQTYQPNIYSNNGYGEEDEIQANDNYESNNNVEEDLQKFPFESANQNKEDFTNNFYGNKKSAYASHLPLINTGREIYSNSQTGVYYENPLPTLKVPAYCFEPLQIFTCLNPTVTGNFWFYNYCKDACMLYTADTCDRNSNKFNSFEMCELRCRQADNEPYLRRKQRQDCQSNRNSTQIATKNRYKKW